MEGMRNVYKNLVRKPEGKIPLGDTDVNGMILLKLSLNRLGYRDVDWILLAEDRFQHHSFTVNMVMNL
jgi:hypothetical protein